jgi:formylmethanofuran dehydrogenase subunit E
MLPCVAFAGVMSLAISCSSVFAANDIKPPAPALFSQLEAFHGHVCAGTTYGNAALAVEDRDEHRLVLTAEGNKRKVEARLTQKAEELGLKSRELGKKAKGLPVGASERVQIEREMEEIFSWLKTAPAEEVVIITLLDKPKGTR